MKPAPPVTKTRENPCGIWILNQSLKKLILNFALDIGRKNAFNRQERRKITLSLVSFVRIRKDTMDSIEASISRSLDLIDFSFTEKIKNIVIKPNLCYYWDYSTGQTTDPKFTAALIDLLRKKISPKVRISIVESDASAMKCKHAFTMLGYERLARDYDVRLVNLSEDLCTTTRVTSGDSTFHIKIPQTIQKADLRINAPKIKYTMRPIEITCALKNIFGCNPYPRKFRYHPALEEAIIASNKAMKFDLCIIDGNIVSGIQPRKFGLTMASLDPVAIDVAAAKIANINPNRIRYIQLASKEGLGRNQFIPKGLPLTYFKKAYPRKTVKTKLIGRAYRLVMRVGLGGRLGLE